MGRTYSGKGRAAYGEEGKANGQMQAWSLNPAGRNRRTVWTIPTAPYSGAHFATYPPALVEPCIKAGTSERGCCPVCGKPWERVTETSGGLIGHSWHDHSNDETQGSRQSRDGIPTGTLIRQGRSTYKRETKGWQPGCSHTADPIPCVVLDPFNGSGTTGMVAQGLGRRYVGLDLSWEYLQLSKERLGIKAWQEWQNGIQAGNDGYHDLPLFQEAA